MKKSKFSDDKIIYALKLADTGTSVAEICRQYGISTNTFYVWKKQFGGISVTEAMTLKLMEKENAKLKKMIAELLLDKTMLQEVIAKKT
jgi:putative transposase